MNNYESLAKMLAPDDHYEQQFLVFRMQELSLGLHRYMKEHPDTKLSHKHILRRVKRRLAWRIVHNYLLKPLQPVKKAISFIQYMHEERKHD